MKLCIRCSQTKPLDEFNNNSRNKDGKHSYCRDCHKAHYKGNKTRHYANVKRVREAATDKIRAYAVSVLTQGCLDCRNSDIRVLEFDHVTGEKVAGVGLMIRMGYSYDKIVEEIAKCEVRCRNCDAIKTYERLGTTWHSAFSPL